MALRTTFGEIIDMTRSEARLSTNSSRGIDHLDHIKQVIRRNYITLAEEFDWEHLNLRRPDAYKTINAGQRYYDFPANLNPQKISEAWFRWGEQWEPVGYGIGNEQYNELDSDLDIRSDPVCRWDYHSDATLNQFEIWPLPATGGTNSLHFIGQKKVQTLVNDGDRADLDDLLIALSAAADLIRDKDERDRKTAQANARRMQLRGALSDKRRFAIGMCDPKMHPQGRRPLEIKFAPR